MAAKKAKPKKKASKKPAKKKTAKKAAKKPVKKKVVKKSSKKPVKKKAVKKSAKKPAKKSVKKTVKKTAKKAAKPAAKPKAKTAKPKAPKKPKGTPITFSIHAPYGWDVALAGSFNKWEPRAMVKETDGWWRITVHLAPGTYEYRFLVDTEWRQDPTNQREVKNEYGGSNSVIDVG